LMGFVQEESKGKGQQKEEQQEDTPMADQRQQPQKPGVPSFLFHAKRYVEEGTGDMLFVQESGEVYLYKPASDQLLKIDDLK